MFLCADFINFCTLSGINTRNQLFGHKVASVYGIERCPHFGEFLCTHVNEKSIGTKRKCP